MDAACKVARGVTGRSKLVGLRGAWHGETAFAMALSSREDKHLFGPGIPAVHQISPEDFAEAAAVVDANTAAVVVEPVQAENGAMSISKEYLRHLGRLCKAAGALLVVDETQTGFGRTGTRFAFPSLGLEPDILVIGEALGGGVFPIAATMMTQKVNAWLNSHPMIHLSTFGGSDVGCKVALEALSLYERTKPWDNAFVAGKRLAKALAAVGSRADIPFVVSGEGALLALGFHNSAVAGRVLSRMRQKGVLAVEGQVDRSYLLLRPHLLLSDSDIDTMVAAVRFAVTDAPEAATPPEAITKKDPPQRRYQRRRRPEAGPEGCTREGGAQRGATKEGCSKEGGPEKAPSKRVPPGQQTGKGSSRRGTDHRGRKPGSEAKE
jgi:acetylornithine/succinyldiaminopimelate/putrescine aminotransferase